MYQQIVLPNYNIPYVGGLCEGFVEGTVGQATLPTPKNPMTYGVWANAVDPVRLGETAAWNINYGGGNHPGEQPPKGLRVPVFFKLGSTPAGHVAIELEDGRIATTPQPGWHPTAGIYPNRKSMIDDYARHNNGCTYLGWSEYIGKLKIVTKGDYMEKPTGEQIDATINYLHWATFGKAPAQDVFKSWKGLLKENYVEGLQKIFQSNDTSPEALKNKPSGGSVYEKVEVYRKVS